MYINPLDFDAQDELEIEKKPLEKYTLEEKEALLQKLLNIRNRTLTVPAGPRSTARVSMVIMSPSIASLLDKFIHKVRRSIEIELKITNFIMFVDEEVRLLYELRSIFPSPSRGGEASGGDDSLENLRDEVADMLIAPFLQL